MPVALATTVKDVLDVAAQLRVRVEGEGAAEDVGGGGVEGGGVLRDGLVRLALARVFEGVRGELAAPAERVEDRGVAGAERDGALQCGEPGRRSGACA